MCCIFCNVLLCIKMLKLRVCLFIYFTYEYFKISLREKGNSLSVYKKRAVEL